MNPLLIFALHRTNPPPPIFSSWNTRFDISYSMPVWLFPWIALSIRKMSWWQMIYYQPVETWYFFKQIEYDPVSSFLATINYEYKIYWRKGVICLFLASLKFLVIYIIEICITLLTLRSANGFSFLFLTLASRRQGCVANLEPANTLKTKLNSRMEKVDRQRINQNVVF